jgi:hypothetical protein
MESSLLRPVGAPPTTAITTNNLRKMADYKTEIFFIGQIVGGSDFPTDIDGLFVEASLKYGAENWHLVPEKANAL